MTKTNLDCEALKASIVDKLYAVTGENPESVLFSGFRDIWDLIMSDSDHSRQFLFLAWLPEWLPDEKDRMALLDQLASDYQGCKDWLSYVDRETSE